MALTTLQGVTDGLLPRQAIVKGMDSGGSAGRWMSTWPNTVGVPVAGGGGATTPGTALTAPVTGQIPFVNPVSGESILAQFDTIVHTQVSDWMLVDRLWAMSGISPTTLTAQTVNSAAWPARDRNQSADGDGVYIALQTTSGLGAAAPVLSYTYTNSAGTGGRVGNNIFATANSPGQGSTWIMGLQAGDTGVRSVQDFTLSLSWISGTISLIAFRPIAYFPGPRSTGEPKRYFKMREDALSLCAPRIWNGSVLELWSEPHTSVVTPFINGTLSVSQG